MPPVPLDFLAGQSGERGHAVTLVPVVMECLLDMRRVHRHTVFGRGLGVDMADGRVRPEQSAPSVEENDFSHRLLRKAGIPDTAYPACAPAGYGPSRKRTR